MRKYFGGLAALDGVDLEVRDGLVTMIVGPNGSGKTTLINTVSGFYKPDSGRIFFNGADITGWPPHKVFKTGLVRTFQIPEPFQKLTVLENMLVARGGPGEGFLGSLFRRSWAGAEERNVEDAFRILELLSLDRLWDRRASELSGGQLKLLEVGRALMSGARMLLMDEPIAGVNPSLAHEVFGHLLEVKKRLGVDLLLVEHKLDIALQYVDYVYAMDRGRVIAEGPPDQVINDKRVIEAYLGG